MSASYKYIHVFYAESISLINHIIKSIYLQTNKNHKIWPPCLKVKPLAVELLRSEGAKANADNATRILSHIVI